MGDVFVNIHFIGNIQRVEKGARILCKQLNVDLSEHGTPIEVTQRPGSIEVIYREGKGYIACDQPIHFFRALGLWIEARREKQSFHITETPQFQTNGVMVDASRNAVMTVGSVKTLLTQMSMMGLNLLMLYTEDTYELPYYPYFGYMRGRYTTEELKECDAYAYDLGIEIVPCIQTLAHLKNAIKWNYASGMRDTEDILLAGSEETYKFIEDMISAVSQVFRTKRIHIGMDEAHRLGLGKYLELHGYRKRFDIMNEHLQRVCSIAERYDLKPMIWSDMYFRLGSKTGNYYDLKSEIPQEVADAIPRAVELVYWDYYHDNPAFYSDFIRKHKQLGSMPIFAGGVWTWNGIAPNYGKTWRTTEAALSACKQEGVKEVFATMWGDNGTETNIMAGLAGLQLFAEHGYAEEVSKEKLQERFRFCAGGYLEDYLLLDDFDTTPGVAEHNPYESNPSKFLLWQDVLMGLYDDNIKGLPMNTHYADLKDRLDSVAGRSGNYNTLFEFYRQLAHVLSIKSELGIRVKEFYDAGDKQKLAESIQQLSLLQENTDGLRKLHRELWLSTYKPFGWEVLDIRYGGVLTRLETAKYRIEEYLSGKIEKIEELEAERLYFDAPWKMPKGSLGRAAYHTTVTAGSLSE
jgi:hexosaminidase